MNHIPTFRVIHIHLFICPAMLTLASHVPIRYTRSSCWIHTYIHTHPSVLAPPTTTPPQNKSKSKSPEPIPKKSGQRPPPARPPGPPARRRCLRLAADPLRAPRPHVDEAGGDKRAGYVGARWGAQVGGGKSVDICCACV